MFRNKAFCITRLFAQYRVKVDILPTCGTHLKDPIISLRGVLGQENKFIVSIFQRSAVPTMKSELLFFILLT